MTSTGIRDLKNNLSRYIRGLRPGNALLVTDRGRIVAELRAPDPVGGQAALTERYSQLIAAGLVRPALRKGDPLEHWPSARQLSLPVGTATQLLDADRDV